MSYRIITEGAGQQLLAQLESLNATIADGTEAVEASAEDHADRGLLTEETGRAIAAALFETARALSGYRETRDTSEAITGGTLSVPYAQALGSEDAEGDIAPAEAGGESVPVYFSGGKPVACGTVGDALSAERDGEGNTISDTYATKTELESGLSAKQDTLTFDAEPAEGSANPVTSGGIYAALEGLKEDVEDGTVTAASASYAAAAGTADSAATAETLGASTVGSGTRPIYLSSGKAVASSSDVGSASTPVYLSGGTITVCSSVAAATASAADYATSSGTADTAASADRLASSRTLSLSGDASGSGTFDGSSDLDIPLTVSYAAAAGQDGEGNAISDTYATKTELESGLSAKQDTLTFDTEPAEGSDNPVTSDGIYGAIAALREDVEDGTVTAAYAAAAKAASTAETADYATSAGSTDTATTATTAASASTADALNVSAAIGSDAQPVYIGSDGVPAEASNIYAGADYALFGDGGASATGGSAIGPGSNAYGDYSLAAGYGNTAGVSGSASDYTYGMAVGSSNTASGTASSAVGRLNTASGSNSTAMGFYNAASGYWSSAVGYGCTASGYRSSAAGCDNTASGSYASAVGYKNTASGSYSAAVGASNTAGVSGSASTYTHDTAMGYNCSATGGNSLAIGSGASATAAGAVAIGYGATCSTEGGVALGKNTVGGKYQPVYLSSGKVTACSSNMGYYYGTMSLTYSRGSASASSPTSATYSSTSSTTFYVLQFGSLYVYYGKVAVASGTDVWTRITMDSSYGSATRCVTATPQKSSASGYTPGVIVYCTGNYVYFAIDENLTDTVSYVYLTIVRS